MTLRPPTGMFRCRPPRSRTRLGPAARRSRRCSAGQPLGDEAHVRVPCGPQTTVATMLPLGRCSSLRSGPYVAGCERADRRGVVFDGVARRGRTREWSDAAVHGCDGVRKRGQKRASTRDRAESAVGLCQETASRCSTDPKYPCSQPPYGHQTTSPARMQSVRNWCLMGSHDLLLYKYLQPRAYFGGCFRCRGARKSGTGRWLWRRGRLTGWGSPERGRWGARGRS